jgi:hypothetical protein
VILPVRRFLWAVHLPDLHDDVLVRIGFRDHFTVVMGDHLSDFIQLVLLKDELEGLAG